MRNLAENPGKRAEQKQKANRRGPILGGHGLDGVPGLPEERRQDWPLFGTGLPRGFKEASGFGSFGGNWGLVYGWFSILAAIKTTTLMTTTNCDIPRRLRTTAATSTSTASAVATSTVTASTMAEATNATASIQLGALQRKVDTPPNLMSHTQHILRGFVGVKNRVANINQASQT